MKKLKKERPIYKTVFDRKINDEFYIEGVNENEIVKITYWHHKIKNGYYVQDENKMVIKVKKQGLARKLLRMTKGVGLIEEYQLLNKNGTEKKHEKILYPGQIIKIEKDITIQYEFRNIVKKLESFNWN